MKSLLLLPLALLVVLLVLGAEAGCRPGFKKPPNVHQTKKNKIRVGWGRAVDNLDCLEEAKVTYNECGGGLGNGYAMKIVPRKEKGNGASFIVDPGRCYDIHVTLHGTDGSQVHADTVSIQMEAKAPRVEVVG